MTLPDFRAWVFSVKVFSAGLLALYISMWAGLSRPYWALATAYITSQAFDGATQSKAIYRALGTAIGAAAAVAILPNVVNSPELTVLAIALWVAVCLYISMLDRTARSYTAMLAGYTVALIGFPAVDDPAGIFEAAMSRTEEITLGILCAALVSGLVLPRSAAPVFAAQLGAWLTSARAWTREVLRREPRAVMDTRAGRLRLASDAIALEALASQLPHEATSSPVSEQALALLRQHMLMLLPLLTSVSDRLKAIDGTEAAAALQPVLDDVADWFQADAPAPEDAAILLARLDAFEHSLREGDLWRDLLVAGLVERLRELVNLKQDIRHLRANIETGGPLAAPCAFQYTAKAREVRHRDHMMAVFSGFGAFIAIVMVCAVWIATGWQDGAAAAMLASVACCFFATQDDPVPAMIGFATAAILGVVGALFHQFALLPRAISFEMIALALAPGLILSGLLMTNPATAAIGLGTAVNGAMALAIQDHYSADFAAFANSGLALVAGVWIATASIAVFRSLDSGWAARRLHAQNRASLALAASGRGSESGLELAALMLDRVALMATRLSKQPPDKSALSATLLREVRIGINVVELRRVRRQVSKPARLAINQALAEVARHFRSGGDKPSAALIEAIDAALAVCVREPETSAAQHATLGLAGLRRALFPTAPDPRLARFSDERAVAA
ncbi:FUSC family protein [Rhodomicrobium lacus]|uniref:FUSC family protein n=1 Tax=Rhodomicrobium lacus TaxID=2498452 RepID=UPI0026E1A56B|nr:FUSC family protein [Rhodomicrobium lacus]WKW51916.1 FUSC family protein [Rhodomicrobium lacus]